MDGFDDLLPSRDGLQNPFEDPFAKARSSSPDPWASFGQATVPSFNEEAFAFGGSTSPTAVTHNAFADADIGGFQDDRDEEHEAERTPATASAAVPDPHEEEGAVERRRTRICQRQSLPEGMTGKMHSSERQQSSRT